MKAELGFIWQPHVLGIDLPESNTARALWRVRKLLAEFVFDTTTLEGNPFTFPEVQTLLEGITVGGHKLSDETQVLNQQKSLKRLLEMVTANTFSVTKSVFSELHSIAAHEEALDPGKFRTGSVGIQGTEYKPPEYTLLDSIFEHGIAYLSSIENPVERAMAFFLFGAHNQFFFDGNKPTSRLMMNGILLNNGFDAISVPAKQRLAFNQKMVRFYDTLEGTEMMLFLLDCSTFKRTVSLKDDVHP